MHCVKYLVQQLFKWGRWLPRASWSRTSSTSSPCTAAAASISCPFSKWSRTLPPDVWPGWDSVLLMQCGWLSVRQMIFYHTVTQLYKIKIYKKPVYLSNKISDEFIIETRLAQGNGIIEGFQKILLFSRNFPPKNFCMIPVTPGWVRAFSLAAILKST